MQASPPRARPRRDIEADQGAVARRTPTPIRGGRQPHDQANSGQARRRPCILRRIKSPFRHTCSLASPVATVYCCTPGGAAHRTHALGLTRLPANEADYGGHMNVLTRSGSGAPTLDELLPTVGMPDRPKRSPRRVGQRGRRQARSRRAHRSIHRSIIVHGTVVENGSFHRASRFCEEEATVAPNRAVSASRQGRKRSAVRCPRAPK